MPTRRVQLGIKLGFSLSVGAFLAARSSHLFSSSSVYSGGILKSHPACRSHGGFETLHSTFTH